MGMDAGECLLPRYYQIIWIIIFKKEKADFYLGHLLGRLLAKNQRQRQPLDSEFRDDRYSFVLKQKTVRMLWLT